MTIQLHAPSLEAHITGLEDGSKHLAIFRGIPFASVTKRWTQSCTLNSLPSPFDATKFGPKCPQPTHISLIPNGMNITNPRLDEFECLNLNITVPSDSLPDEKSKGRNLLPVMVWVHGGAFKNGSNSAAKYQPEILSAEAKAIGNPVVIVQIQYRLGAFGFVSSSDLASEHDSLSSATSNEDKSTGVFGNFGLVDQRNAFAWVQNHIQDFGGDPSNVTAIGLSAGSASLHMHILSGIPLFDRAILMSGSAPMMGPVAPPALQAGWDRLCKKAGVLEATGEKRLEQLRAIPPEALIEISASTLFAPLADGKFPLRPWNLGDVQSTCRCKEIVIGDSRIEGIIFDSIVRQIPQSLFHKVVHSTFTNPSDATKFCELFGYTSEEQPYEKFRDATRFFISTVIFHFPNLRIAETFSGKAYLYHFEQNSPYPGPANGLPIHGLCAVTMYGNDRDAWSNSATVTSREMIRLCTQFAHGKEPWKDYQASKEFMRFDPDGQCQVSSIENDKIRDYGYLDWLRTHFEEVKRLVFRLSAG